MNLHRFARSLMALALMQGSGAQAVGDLLVAPTRVVLESARGTEVILNNIDSVPGTYRISLELRRMTPEGTLAEVETAQANAVEAQALAMISYAPRKVVLAPNQPQSIRIGVRPSADLPDGEYRVHMLFQGIPAAKPVTAEPTAVEGVKIQLIPIYGVTIPIIVRKGAIKATASLSEAHITSVGDKTELTLSLSREGGRSTYGHIRVLKSGQSKPVYEAKGIAVYPEINKRAVHLPLDPDDILAMTGPVTVQYVEELDAGGRVMAEIQTVLR
jgi:P pilus assembly chaperone PapD